MLFYSWFSEKKTNSFVSAKNVKKINIRRKKRHFSQENFIEPLDWLTRELCHHCKSEGKLLAVFFLKQRNVLRQHNAKWISADLRLVGRSRARCCLNRSLSPFVASRNNAIPSPREMEGHPLKAFFAKAWICAVLPCERKTRGNDSFPIWKQILIRWEHAKLCLSFI